VRGVRMQLHWHENPLYRFATRPDLCADPVIRRNVGWLADYGWSFDLQVFAPQMADAAGLAEACPKVTFILQHAGMLEDLLQGRAAWRAGMARLALCPNVVSKLSGLGTFIHRNDGAHIADVLDDTVAIFGAERCLFGSNFPIEKLWTSYRDLVDAYRTAAARLRPEQRDAIFATTATRVYRLGP
jgi:predicted TIM-barrel fold metal-dependent hydrolase